MNNRKIFVLSLSIAAMVLVLTASLVGIISDDGGKPYTFTSLRGEVIEIYGGQGLYQNDSITKAVMFRGFDWVGLVIIAPLLALGILLYHRGRLRGQLLLGSIFTYFAYIYLIGVMGNAFNIMFLVWVGLFSVGLLGLTLILTDIDLPALPQKLDTGFPRKSLTAYLVALGMFLPIPYLAEIIPAYITARPPATLEIYTTLELAAVEIGLMTPLHLVGGVLLWKRNAWGYILVSLLAFAASMTFISMSIFQGLLYYSFQMGGLGELVRFIVFAVIASGFSFVIFKQVKD